MKIRIDDDNTLRLPVMATPDWLVAMADGTFKPFKELRVGDQVVSDRGNVQIVREIPA